MQFSYLVDRAIGQDESLASTRAQLKHLDADVASDTVVLRRKDEAAGKIPTQTTELHYCATYAINEATFDRDEHMEIEQRLCLARDHRDQ